MDERFQELIERELGPKPTNPIKLLDYKITVALIEKIWAGSPRFILFRCLSCNKVMSGRFRCPCGGSRFSPTAGSTWKAFWVWIRRR